jgi:N-acetylglucosaminyldiphosphoundecaprenol N-acetyl-beta-D-mannosaminyltransferase
MTAPVVPCAGLPITATTRAAAARTIVDLALSPGPSGVDVHLCNAYTLALADRDRDLADVLLRAGLNLPDGKSVVWANRLTHRELDLPSERVYGPDLFRDVFALGQDVGLRHYLLGSTWEVLAELDTALRRRHGRAGVVGMDSPPFRALTDRERTHQLERIGSSGAQIVWVGLGTPKQDFEVARLARELPLVFVAVGAAFDFVAGTKPQAPLWMQHNGLEWVFRLGSEPSRLWRRYLFGNVRFVRAAVQHGRTRVPDR